MAPCGKTWAAAQRLGGSRERLLIEDVKMPSYVHRGVVQSNGLVESAQVITDPAVLTVRPADDALQLTSLRSGILSGGILMSSMPPTATS